MKIGGCHANFRCGRQTMHGMLCIWALAAQTLVATSVQALLCVLAHGGQRWCLAEVGTPVIRLGAIC